MLGIVHRTVLGKGPPQFKEFFQFQGTNANPNGRECKRRHTKQLVTHREGKFLDLLSHSALGLCDVYNLLPDYVAEAGDISDFQARLQTMIKEAASSGCDGWHELLSPRISTHRHPLREWMGWCPVKTKEQENERRATSNNVACTHWLRFQSGGMST